MKRLKPIADPFTLSLLFFDFFDFSPYNSSSL